VLVASLLVERRWEEIAMLRSRGASAWQVLTTAAIEASLLGVGAALAAPFLAAGAVAMLGKTGTFKPVSGGDFLAYTVVPDAVLLAAAGSALAVLSVLLPTFVAARRSMLEYLRGSARPQEPILQRYYLDFAVAGLAALALWELNQRGSVYDPRSVGGWSADPLLLASPILLILAVGALMFRFLPLILSVVSRVMSLTSGPGVTLGLWQLTRSPSRYSQLALLVIMAASVGTFAATYGETTDRSQDDRALYEAGVDAHSASLGRLNGKTSEELVRELSTSPEWRRRDRVSGKLRRRAATSASGIPARPRHAKSTGLCLFSRRLRRRRCRLSSAPHSRFAGGGGGSPLPDGTVAVTLWANHPGAGDDDAAAAHARCWWHVCLHELGVGLFGLSQLTQSW
jgi:hypothetical protein